jgi:hypothetical protein
MHSRLSRLAAACLSLALACAATVASARDPVLRPPIDCDLSRDCFIPRYVDVDPSAGAADYMCGPLTGDGHKGTDFALPTLAEMAAGVPVRPAAPGTVTALRDGEADVGAEAMRAGRECGNGVVIDHGGGWETQYCHLKQGSIDVREGQRVSLATVLGEVGLSGQTSFPHVHLSVRRDGVVIDPFAPAAHAECGQSAGPGLWSDPPPYRPAGLIAAGFAPEVPAYDAIKAGTAGHTALPPAAEALVLWAYAFGGQQGDRLAFTIAGPQGEVIASEVEIDRAQPLYFRAVGRRRPGPGWPEGTYRGRITLLRDGETIETRDATLSIAR